MREHAPDCTCWRVRTDTGEILTGVQVQMHPRVALITQGGQRVEGRPDGMVWYREQGLVQPGVAIEMDDGEDFCVPLAQVDSITPLVTPDPVEILESVAHLLRRPMDIELDEVWFTSIAGPHEVVEICVTLRRDACRSNEPPPQAFTIEVVNLPNG